MNSRAFYITLLVSSFVHLSIAIFIVRAMFMEPSTPAEQFIELVYQQYEKSLLMEAPEDPGPVIPPAAEPPAEVKPPEPTPSPEPEPPPPPEVRPTDVFDPAAKVEEKPPVPVVTPEEAEALKKAEEAKREEQKRQEEEKKRQEEIQKQKQELQKRVDALPPGDAAANIVSYADLLREFITVNFKVSERDKIQILQALKNPEGVVHVYFILTSNGALLDVYIPDAYQTSCEQFNEMAIRSIREAAKRFPSFPKTYSKEIETFDVVIRISLRQSNVDPQASKAPKR